MQKHPILSSNQILNNLYTPEDGHKPGNKQKSCQQEL